MLTFGPLNVARADMACSGSPARRPGPKRRSALPLIASGIPVTLIFPERSDCVSEVSCLLLFNGESASRFRALNRSRVASTDMLFSPTRAVTSENWTAPRPRHRSKRFPARDARANRDTAIKIGRREFAADVSVESELPAELDSISAHLLFDQIGRASCRERV